MKGAFVVNPTFNNDYIICLTEQFHEDFPNFICEASYSVLAARLLGMSYSNYCRYCVANGAELHNRDGYPVAHFKGRGDAENICKQINEQYEIFKKSLVPTS